MVPMARMVHKVKLDHKDLKEIRVTPVHQDRKVRLDLRVHKVKKVTRETKEILVHKVMLDYKAPKGKLDLRDPQAWMVLMAPLVRRDQKEIPATQDRKVRLDLRDFKGKKVTKEIPGHKDPQA
jgi:hypothetical protein